MSNPSTILQKALEAQRLGRAAEAIQLFGRVLSKEPRNVTALYHRSVLLHKAGKGREALRGLEDVVGVAPRLAEGHFSLATVLFDLGLLDRAEGSYRTALALQPGLGLAHLRLAEILLRTGRPADALQHARRAVEMVPDDARAWTVFSGSLDASPEASVDDGFEALVCRGLDEGLVASETVAACVTEVVLREPCARQIVEARNDASAVDRIVREPAMARIYERPMLLALLERGLVTTRGLEHLLTALRGAILRARPERLAPVGFVCALAAQCFTNEYVFATSPDEDAAVDEIVRARSTDPCDLALLAAYSPLSRVPYVAELEQMGWPEELARVWRRQVEEPAIEAGIRNGIERVTRIDDETSLRVQGQYEASPYPRWVVARRIGLDATLPGGRSPDGMRVLVAGCGTGWHSIMTASTFPRAEILAVDLSSASLAYAERKTRELGLTNIRHVQGDILNLDLPQRFDLIESVGVLHHLREPATGLRALRKLARPGAIFKLGLYSRTARRGISEARRRVGPPGFVATPETIREARQRLFALRADDPARSVTRASDFYSTSMCRDLLFHVEEHVLDLDEVRALLEGAGLELVGLIPPSDRVRYEHAKLCPDDGTPSLASWQRFEEQHPDTFLGMYMLWARAS